MLKVNLSPVRSNQERLTASWFAPILTVGEVEYDLSELPDGATAEHPVLGIVSRDNEDYEVTLRMPHGPKAPEETRFPKPVIMYIDGFIKIPPWTSEV